MFKSADFLLIFDKDQDARRDIVTLGCKDKKEIISFL